MPLTNSLLNLNGFVIETLKGINPIELIVRYEGEVTCPRCSSVNLRIKSSFTRRIQHESMGNRRTKIRLQSHKYLCKSCLRYFNQQFPGILKWHRATEGFHRKMKLIQRRAYGFKNFENYRLRVRSYVVNSGQLVYCPR